jgi:DNA-binding NarL/FixJ family response regulator
MMIQMLLVDDQEFVRQGLKTLLETQPDLQVMGEAENGRSTIDLLRSFANQTSAAFPDIVLMDIRMPVMDGVETTKHLCQQFPGIKILVLTTFNDTQYVAEALRFGAKGYLMKDTPTEELAKAIRSIHQGYTQFGPGIMEKLIAHHAVAATQPPEQPSELLALSARERSVLRLIATGANNREIAQALFLTEGTVRNYISNILGQLNLRDRTQAAIVANTFRTWLENSEPLDEDS